MSFFYPEKKIAGKMCWEIRLDFRAEIEEREEYGGVWSISHIKLALIPIMTTVID